MKKKLPILLLFLLKLTTSLFSQIPIEKATLRGKVTSKHTNTVIANISIKIPALNIMVYTDDNGNFGFASIPYGSYEIEVGDTLFQVKVLVDEPNINLGELKVSLLEEENSNHIEMGIAFDDVGITEISESVNNVFIPSVNTAYHNQIIASSVSHFLPFGFKLRGYTSHHSEVYINGLRTNNLLTGNPGQNQWAGLQEIMSATILNLGLQYNEQFMGGAGGISGLTAYAADFRARTSISYTLTNRTYKHQLNLAHHTGLLPNGWAVSAVINTRIAEEGYIQGTHYESYGYALAISKTLSPTSKLHILSYGTSIRSGSASPVTEEMYSLSGTNYYNPNWGYQEGEKRNAKEYTTFIPTTILNWELKKTNTLQVNVGVSLQAGHSGYSSLDWYDAADPRPDYYVNLPSYYLHNPQGVNEEEAMRRSEFYKNNPDALQINWREMYDANRLNKQTVNGVTGNRSVYALGQDKTKIKVYSIFTNFQQKVSNRLSIYGGLNYQIQQTEHYREMLDLLGGDYYVNHNRFAERTFLGNEQYKQNDLNNPDGIIREGDKFNYHYGAFVQKGSAWLQSVYYLGRFDLYGAVSLGIDNFYRNGMFKNGVYHNESYGKSKHYGFLTGQARGGITYKIDGRQNIIANAAWIQNAPKFDNIFIAPRIRNTALEQQDKEDIKSIELGYLYTHHKMLFSLKAFATDINNSTQTLRFYHEEIKNFVTYAMQNVDTRHIGMEISLSVKIQPQLSLVSAVNLMQVFYTNRPNVSIYKDNDTMGTVTQEAVYIKNYFVGNAPQTVYNAGLLYFNDQKWSANIFANFAHDNYVSINPTRRTEQATTLIPSNSEQYNNILSQQKLPSFFTVDFRVAKTITIAAKSQRSNNALALNIAAGINNLSNNQMIITNAYEQLRYDFNSGNPDRFPPKYTYALGRNYYLNLRFTF